MCAEEEAAEEEQFKEICEVEIVKRNLLGLFGPLLGYIVVDTDKHFAHPLLRESALLALSKYMCVSSTFCEEVSLDIRLNGFFSRIRGERFLLFSSAAAHVMFVYDLFYFILHHTSGL